MSTNNRAAAQNFDDTTDDNPFEAARRVFNDAPPAPNMTTKAHPDTVSELEARVSEVEEDDDALKAAITFADEVRNHNEASLRTKFADAPHETWLNPDRSDLDDWTTQQKFVIYKTDGVRDNRLTPAKCRKFTAREFVDQFKPYPVPQKDAARGWLAREVISHDIKEGKSGNRGQDNVGSVSLIVLDVDNKEGKPLYACDIRKVLKRAGLAGLIMESFSSTPELPKFRIVLFLLSPFAVGEDAARHALYKRFYAYLMRLFPGADPATKDVSRFWYDPSYPVGGQPGICEFVSGNMLEAYYVSAQMPEPERAKARQAGKARACLGAAKATNFGTVDLLFWMVCGGKHFEYATWREDQGYETRATNGEKRAQQCPNDPEHTNAGDHSDTAFVAVNASESENGECAAWCLHTCQEKSGKDRLWYIAKDFEAHGVSSKEDFDEIGRNYCNDQFDSAKWMAGPKAARDLPPGFLRKNGMIYSGAPDEDEDEEETQERGLLICSDFQCASRARDADSGAWSRVIEFKNGEGVEKSVAVGDAELQGDGVEVRARLAGEGLFISTNPKARREFMRLLNTVRSESLERHAPRTGFMGGNNEVFVLPVEVAGFGAAVFAPEASDELKAEKHIWTKRPADFTPTSRGTLQGWQEGANIAFKSDAQGQIAAPHVAEGILRGACGPLIALADRDPMGMHYVGASSTGKTTQGMAQVSPWSDVVEGRGLMFTAKGTINANESALEAMNHTTGVINDLENSPDPTLARELPYTAAGRGGKRRKDKNLNDRRAARWGGLSFTMNSERSPQQLMGKYAAQTSGGLVRAPVLNTSNVPKMDKATIDKMTGAFSSNFAHAGAHLVSGLYKRGWHRDIGEMKKRIDAYHKEHTEGLEPAQRRSLEVYAYARVAGDLMVEDGIFGPDIAKDDVAAVVRWAIDQAKASPEFQKMNASKNGARQLIEFLNTSGQVYETNATYEGRATPLAWKDVVAGVAYVPQSNFGKFEGITASEADIVAELKKNNLLIKRSGERWLHGHLPGLKSVKHYRINLEAANKLYSDGDYAPPSAEERAFAAAKRGDAVTVKADPLDAVVERLRSPWRAVGKGMEVAKPKALGEWVRSRRRRGR